MSGAARQAGANAGSCTAGVTIVDKISGHGADQAVKKKRARRDRMSVSMEFLDIGRNFSVPQVGCDRVWPHPRERKSRMRRLK
jgi:hypothetical protein